MVLNFSDPDDFPWLDNREAGVQLVMGVNYSLVLTSGSFAPEYVGAWIDWNGDDDFDDTFEHLGTTLTSTPYEAVVLGLAPPFEHFGYCRLRVRAVYNDPLMTACSDAAYGETQDFTISVRAPTMPCMPLLGYGGATAGRIAAFSVDGTDYLDGQGYMWPYYTLHNSTPHHFTPGVGVAAWMQAGSSVGNSYDLMMDLNGDGDMNDANELLWFADNISPSQTLNMNFTIPLTCPPGQYLLRLRGYPITSAPAYTCDDLVYGEIQDVVIVVEEVGGYCLPWSSWWTTDGDFISGLTLNTVQNLGTGGYFGPAYSDFTAISIDLERGADYDFGLQGGDYFPDVYAVYIDYNHDGVFDEATESISAPVVSTTFLQWMNIPFTVPLTALLGPTRMRVRSSYAAAGIGPCADTGYGETQDYTVVIYTSTGLTDEHGPDLRAWPDAGSGNLMVQGAGPAGAPYEVMDATGRVVRNGRVEAERFTIACAGLTAGTYTLRIGAAGGEVRRFMWIE
ncbi:MAG: hypothetical protein IPL52_06500 [Flavobacteriales bacterium]|nr:hypothetical protein [Flavobacteriales bacterium]